VNENDNLVKVLHFSICFRKKKVYKVKLDVCIVLNEHNTVFISKKYTICNGCFPRPIQVLDANGISIASAVFAGLTRWQTDRPCYSVSNNRRHLCT